MALYRSRGEGGFPRQAGRQHGRRRRLPQRVAAGGARSRRSAVAASAHLAGDRLEDGRGGVVHDFRGKAVPLRGDAAARRARTFRDRETLWNAAEAAETRINSRVGREILAVLPRELSDAENLELVRDFVRERLVERGMCCDFAIHAPTASDGLAASRPHPLLSPRGRPRRVRRQVREWDKRELVTSLRQEWAADCNRSLELAGRRARLAPLPRGPAPRRARARRLRTGGRALDRLPGVHLGPAAAAMEREGIRTDIGDELRAIAEENAARAAAYEAVREMAADVPEAPARFLECGPRAPTRSAPSSNGASGRARRWSSCASWRSAAVERVQECRLGLGQPRRRHVAHERLRPCRASGRGGTRGGARSGDRRGARRDGPARAPARAHEDGSRSTWRKSSRPSWATRTTGSTASRRDGPRGTRGIAATSGSTTTSWRCDRRPESVPGGLRRPVRKPAVQASGRGLASGHPFRTASSIPCDDPIPAGQRRDAALVGVVRRGAADHGARL